MKGNGAFDARAELISARCVMPRATYATCLGFPADPWHLGICVSGNPTTITLGGGL